MVSNDEIKKQFEDKVKPNSKLKKEELCPKCGTENPKNAQFCGNCGTKLKQNNINSSSVGIIKGTKNWWNQRTSNEKGLTAISACCLGLILIVMIAAFMAPESTNLSIPTANAQIDDKTTEYIINGTAEPNATIKLSSTGLNFNDNITSDINGNFEYKLQIPLEITDLTVSIEASKPQKLEKSVTLNIQRPTTPLKLVQPPNITEENKTITIEGSTDPQAEVSLESPELNLTNADVNVKSDGTFQHNIQVQDNITSATVTVNAKSSGKKAITQKTSITRTITQKSTTQNSASSTDSSSSSSVSSSSSSSSTSTYYVGSSKSDVYHYPSCYHVKQIKSSNLIRFNSVQEAKNRGYRACKDCNPPR